MNDEEFFQWYNGAATSNDLALMERVEEFGEYFEDVLFKPGTVSYQLTTVRAGADDCEIGDDLPDELADFDYSWFRYKAAEQDDCDGSFNSEQSLLCVPVEAEDSTVLHEMIHLHESPPIYSCALQG